MTMHPALVIFLLKALIEGLSNHLPQGVTQLSLDGVLTAVADIVATLREYLGIYEAPSGHYGAWRDSLHVREHKADVVEKLIRDLHLVLKSVVGKESQDLRLFGMTPPKERQELTEEQKLQRVQKAKATRAKRHTMGKRQKAKIHGEAPQQGGAPNPGDSKPDAKA